MGFGFGLKDNFIITVTINFISGLLRLQQIYQGLKPGNQSFQVETVKRISNVSMAIDFLRTLEELNRWSKKYVVLDCPTNIAKEIVVSHVRDVTLGRRTYHYLLSGLVSVNTYFCYFFFSFSFGTLLLVGLLTVECFVCLHNRAENSKLSFFFLIYISACTLFYCEFKITLFRRDNKKNLCSCDIYAKSVRL